MEGKRPYRQAKCQGILGWLFGHKFLKSTLDYERERDYCWRCGMPRGGWRGPTENGPEVTP